MNLPYAEKVQVDREKITDYLLCVSHPDGAAKAVFFLHHGVRCDAWRELAEALRRHGTCHPVSGSIVSQYGTKYSVDGVLASPSGRNPKLRTVWIVEHGGDVPRLVTAYPL